MSFLSSGHINYAYLLCMMALFNVSVVRGQEPPSDDQVTHANELPPLGDLIDSAIINAPAVRYHNAQVLAGKAVLGGSRLSWTDAASFSFNTQYGAFGGNELAQLSLGYGFGFGVKFSLFDLLNQPFVVKSARQDVEAALAKRDGEIAAIRQMVILQYQTVDLAEKKLQAASQSESAMVVHHQMAEKEFLEGEIHVSELARVTDMALKAKSSFEEAESNYKAAIIILEEITGVKLVKRGADQ